MGSRSPSRNRGAFAKRINQAHSPVLARSIPWLSVLLGSLLPQWLAIASAPLLPPLGYLILLSWRQLRPGLLPVWAGLPLGLFDDLFSGQPFGSAILLWSVTLLLMEIVELRFPWRSFVIDWVSASGIIVLYLVACLGLANAGGGHATVIFIMPQLILSILVYPLTGRLVGWLDQIRLKRFRIVS